MPERILVTGGGGFLGSHICHYFGQRGNSIVAVDRVAAPPETTGRYLNLSNFHAMTLPDNRFIAILQEFQPSLLIHCAGSASVPNSVQEPYEDFQQAAGVTAFILETLRNYTPSCHFVFLSSAAVYGNPQKLPVGEESPCQPISPYGYHKYICEMLCREYESIYHMKCSVLRIFSAYGERLRKQVIHDLCRKFSDPSFNSVELFGTGNETRDFVHAHDIARAIECILNANASGLFNVASGIQTRISEIVEMIKDCFHSTKEIVYSGAIRPGDPLYWQADISRLAALGFRQEVAFREGIQHYCRWFESLYGK
jgi:UDP-glucose 4-epimerase